MTETETRREIAARKARVVYLVDLVEKNAPHISTHVLGLVGSGHFSVLADRLREYADNLDEVARLKSEIVQMTLELEPRTFQLGLSLPGEAVPA